MDAVRRQLAHGDEPLLVVPTRADVEHYLRELAGDGRRAGRARRALRRARSSEVARARGPERAGARRASRASGCSAALAARGAGRPGARPVRRALGELIAELQVRRVSARAAAATRSARWAAATAAAAESAARPDLYGDYQRRARSGSDAWTPSSAPCARSTRCARARRCGAPRRVLVLRLRRPHAAAARRDRDARPVVDAAGHGRRWPTSRAGSRSPVAPRPSTRSRRSPPSTAAWRPAPSYYAPPRARRCRHLERSLFEADAARACDPAGAVRLLEGGGERAELELVAARDRRAARRGHRGGGDRGRASAPAGSARSCSRRSSRAAGVPFAHAPPQRRSPTPPSAAALIGLLRCAASSAQRDADARRPAAPGCARPGCSSAPSWPTGSSCAAGAPARAAPRRRASAVGGAQLAAGGDRPARRGRSGAGPRADRARRARARAAVLRAPPRRGERCCHGPRLDEARALAAGRARPWRAARARARRGRRPGAGGSRRAGRCARAASSSQRRAAGPGRGGGARPARAARAAGARAVPLRPAGRRLPGPARDRSRSSPRRSAGGSPQTRACVLGEPQDALAAERYLLYAVVSRPEELLVLSWHSPTTTASRPRGRCSSTTSATCSPRSSS